MPLPPAKSHALPPAPVVNVRVPVRMMSPPVDVGADVAVPAVSVMAPALALDVAILPSRLMSPFLVEMLIKPEIGPVREVGVPTVEVIPKPAVPTVTLEPGVNPLLVTVKLTTLGISFKVILPDVMGEESVVLKPTPSMTEIFTLVLLRIAPKGPPIVTAAAPGSRAALTLEVPSK